MKKNSFWSRLSLAVFIVCSFTGFACFADGSKPAEKSFSFSELGQKAAEKVDSSSLGIKAVDNGAEIICKLQAIEALVTQSGISIKSISKSEGSGTFNMKVAGLGRVKDKLSPLSSDATVKVSNNCAQIVHPEIVEEFTVSGDGIRQDFIVTKKPEGNDELVLAIGLGSATAELSGSALKIRLTETGREFAYSKLLVTDAVGKKLPSGFKINSQNEFVIAVDDSGATYPIRIDPTISDANWVSMGVAQFIACHIFALAYDSFGNLYVGGEFNTLGEVLANNIAKWDGSRWSDLGLGIDTDAQVFALACDSSGNLYAGGNFITVGGVSANYIAKWNGFSWSTLGSGMAGGDDPSVNALACDSSGNLYAGGGFITAGGVAANRIAKWNPATSSWSTLGSGMAGGDYPYVSTLAFDVSGNLYAGGGFIMAGGVTVNRIAKWNPGTSSWSAIGSGMAGGDPYVSALAFDSSRNLYAGGGFITAGGVTVNRIAKWNGSSWSALGSGLDGDVSAIVCDSSGNLYTGGYFTIAGGVAANCIAKWNGSSWSALGSGLDEGVAALAFDLSGNLYAGRWLAGEVPANGIAKWNGTTWYTVGKNVLGIDGDVTALAFDPSGNLYVGGGFYNAGGVAVNRIAKWNGSSWSALGSGLDGNVYTLVCDSSGNLYAGGEFYTADDVNGIAKWNGSSWSALGLGLYGTVSALTFDSSGNLYAGGEFSTAGDVQADHIAKWNGSSWSALGLGTDGGVNALAFDPSGNLYAGGHFYNAGGVQAKSIAKWNGTAWSELGFGIGGTVNALVCDSSGNIYAGGDFTTAGGLPANKIAKWNPTTFSWSTFGSGMNSTISTLVCDSSGNIYAGGDFTIAGGVPANRIVKLAPTTYTWSTLGSGMAGGAYPYDYPYVRALAFDLSGNLFVGGWFTTAGGKDSYCLAKCQIAPATVPGAPIEITAVGGNAQATVSFSPPISDGGEPITSYTVTSIPGGITATETTSPITVIGLKNGKSYKFTVSASNNIGTGPESASSNAVTPGVPLTAIGAISGTAKVGSILTAGALTPAGATVIYQWSSSTTAGGTYTNIAGATAKAYKPVAGITGMFLKVTVTGTRTYLGRAISTPTTAVTVPVTAIGAITPAAKVGTVLTAGAVKPVGATVSYQWKIAVKSTGEYTVIDGATSSTYTPVPGNAKKFLKVVVTGTGNYSGTVMSAATAAIPTPLTSIGAITGVTKVGSILTAGTLIPDGATATYQWASCATAGGIYATIPGATAKTYKPVVGTTGKFLKVMAKGTGRYSGTVTSAPTTAVAP